MFVFWSFPALQGHIVTKLASLEAGASELRFQILKRVPNVLNQRTLAIFLKPCIASETHSANRHHCDEPQAVATLLPWPQRAQGFMEGLFKLQMPG